MSYGSDLYKARERAFRSEVYDVVGRAHDAIEREFGVTDKKRTDLKAAQKKDATAEERELSKTDTGQTRHSGSWERDVEYARAQAAARRVDAASATERTGDPEVPGEDTYTHGGSGEPPNVDPEVQALLDSGVPLEVGGDNKLREVKTDKTN